MQYAWQGLLSCIYYRYGWVGYYDDVFPFPAVARESIDQKIRDGQRRDEKERHLRLRHTCAQRMLGPTTFCVPRHLRPAT